MRDAELRYHVAVRVVIREDPPAQSDGVVGEEPAEGGEGGEAREGHRDDADGAQASDDLVREVEGHIMEGKSYCRCKRQWRWWGFIGTRSF